MKNLAELKRKIKIGTKIKKIAGCLYSKDEFSIGKIRTITKIQTNAIFIDDARWDYPNSKLIEFVDENTFKFYYPKQDNYNIYHNEKGDLKAIYTIIEE